MKGLVIFICFLLFVKFADAQQSQGDPTITEIWNPVPKLVRPGQWNTLSPSDAIILFHAGKDSSNWMAASGKAFGWKVSDSFMMVTPEAGNIRTKKSFGDCQLHIEWRA